MSNFCNAKATHIFSAKKLQNICVSLDVNFNESLTNDIISFEQLGPEFLDHWNLDETKVRSFAIFRHPKTIQKAHNVH